MTQVKTKIPAEMEPAAVGGMVTDSKYIIDREQNKNQTQINTETDERITTEVGRAEQAESTLDGKIAAEKTRAEGVEGGLNTRLQTVEQLAEISVGGGDIGIGTAADFESDDPEDLAKVPTIGAVLGHTDDEPTPSSEKLVKSGGVAETNGFTSNSPEFLEAHISKSKRLMYGVEKDGNFFFGGGIPKQIQKVIIDLESLIKEYGEYKSSKEFLAVLTDSKKRILAAFSNNDVILGCGVPSQIRKYVKEQIQPLAEVPITPLFVVNDDIKFGLGTNSHFGQGARGIEYYDKYSSAIIENIVKENTTFIRTQLSPELYSLKHKGIEVLAALMDGVFTPEQIISTLDTYLNNYDGNTQLTTLSGDSVRIKVSYWSYFNELDTKWKRGLVSTEDAFTMYKTAYNKVKAFNPEYTIVLGGISNVSNGFLDAMLEYDDDQDGLRFWDLFDVFAYHTYDITHVMNDAVFIRDKMVEYYDINNVSNFIDKPVWLTEYNTPSYDNGDYVQAITIPKAILEAFSMGVEKAFIYQAIDDTDINSIDRLTAPKESFFGLAHRLYPNKSYISYLANDGSGNAISIGSDLKRVYFDNTGYSYISCINNNSVLSNLKNKGLIIGGDKFTLTSVDILKDYVTDGEPSSIVNLWTGSTLISSQTTVSLNSNDFASLESGDVVRFTVSPTDIDYNNLELENKLGYKSLKFVQKLLIQSNSVVKYYKNNNICKLSWELKNGSRVSCIWATDNINVKVSNLSDNYKVYNYLGEIINPSLSNYTVGIEPIYIVSGSNIYIGLL